MRSKVRVSAVLAPAYTTMQDLIPIPFLESIKLFILEQLIESAATNLKQPITAKVLHIMIPSLTAEEVDALTAEAMKTGIRQQGSWEPQ